jgi:hypothetical protein
MTALKALWQKLVEISALETDYSTLVALAVAALVFVISMSVRQAIEVMPRAPSGVTYPIHSEP